MSKVNERSKIAQDPMDEKQESTKKSRRNTLHIRTSLLNKLQDCEFHSGEDLAKYFELSRSAISNHIRVLSGLGLEIFSVKGRGYKLAQKIELLSHTRIIENLSLHNQRKKDLIRIENIVTSTNDLVKIASNEQPLPLSGFCCLAEAQTAGRGRRGRTWVSPYGSSLYFSMLWHFASGYQAMAGLSVMVGVVVNRTLQNLGINGCKLKWPNDVFYNHKKLAGILIEVEGQVGSDACAIIGIGINLQLPSNVQGIEQAFTDTASINENKVSRNAFASQLIENLWQALPEFEKTGLSTFLNEWKQADLYINQTINLVAGAKITSGICRGIDPNGAILLELKSATGILLKAFHGGEISVRPA